jgi:hypothetical protein
MTEERNNGSELMSHQDRCEWLRERGVIIETVEDRRRLVQKQQTEPNNKAKAVEKILFVRVPWDVSQPLEQCEMYMAESSFSNASVSVDPLSDMLAQSVFSSSSEAAAAAVDLELLPSRNTTLLSSTGGITVSDESLRSVANRGCCETFRLVPPMPSNSYNAIYAYLDEVGMLKRLPLNKRASDFAYHAGFNPPPKFYGDIYLGRVHYSPDHLRKKNVNFYLGPDTDVSSTSTTNGKSYSWLRQATVENLQFHQQQEQNKIDMASSSNEKLSTVGEDGVLKEEGLYSWTQTLDDIELLIPLPEEAEKKQISVVFHPKRVKVLLLGKSNCTKNENADLVDIELYAPIDVDGCTWTFEKSTVEGHTNKVIVTCEKQDGGVTWPRINF